jgi:hypothetical protein
MPFRFIYMRVRSSATTIQLGRAERVVSLIPIIAFAPFVPLLSIVAAQDWRLHRP